MTAQNQPIRYSDAELLEFKKLIEAKKASIEKNIKVFDPTIPAEALSIERLKTLDADMDKALSRIEAKTYGICTKTGQLINKGRLRSVPQTLFITEKSEEKRISIPV